MAWNNYNSDEGKFSEYNTAALKMKRLDSYIDEIGHINGNLTAYNYDYDVYNFELKLAHCDTLYLEVESKLKKEEKTDIEALRNVIHKLIEMPELYFTKKKLTYPPKKQIFLNKQIVRILIRWLFEYDKKLKRLLDEHGLDTKYEDESALF